MIIEELDEYLQINTAITRLFEKTDDASKIKKIIKYVYGSGGKKIRPILLLLCTEICKGDKDKSINAAIAIELIHAASLIHDDMLDEGFLRRGIPSAHKKYGSSAALLCGDYLISCAITLISFYESQIVSAFGKAGMYMAEGEIIDIGSANEHFEKETYFDCIIKKTASLFACSAFIGAVSAKCEYEKALSLYKFGENLGIAYQMVDDLLEFSSHFNDKKSTKSAITLPKIYSRSMNYDAAVQKTIADIEKYVYDAKCTLECFDPCPAKDKMLLIADHITLDLLNKKIQICD